VMAGGRGEVSSCARTDSWVLTKNGKAGAIILWSVIWLALSLREIEGRLVQGRQNLTRGACSCFYFESNSRNSMGTADQVRIAASYAAMREHLAAAHAESYPTNSI